MAEFNLHTHTHLAIMRLRAELFAAQEQLVEMSRELKTTGVTRELLVKRTLLYRHIDLLNFQARHIN